MKPDLLVSDSGDGKTSLLGTAAIYHYKRTGKPSLLISGDGGGWGPCQPLINIGVMEVVDAGEHLVKAPFAFEVSQHVCKGERLEGGKWVLPDLSRYAAFFIEGLTAFSEIQLSAIAEKAAQVKGEKMEDNGDRGLKAGIRFEDGQLKLGSNSLSHYNIVQNEVRKLVAFSSRLPGPVIWTALETKEMDEGQGRIIYGPQLAGSAKTAIAPSWFGHCLGIEIRPKKDDRGKADGVERVLHTQKWYDAGAVGRPIPHLAKTRDTPLGVFIRDHAAKGITIPPECRVPPEVPCSLETFYETYAKAVKSAEELLTRYLKEKKQ